jgi:nitrogen fixation protein NifB
MVQLKVVSQPASGCKASSCGAGGDKLAHLPEGIRERVFNHPCYSEQAHHHFARMHVAVAPACNIQCNYCNRKYDCANESRPGVVSEVLTPEQAAKKTLAVAAAIPQMSVIGIAGPGDPLANPARTFETFRLIQAQAPDLKLCLSTNGLTLPDHVEQIAALKIDHVTITINCVDPAVGAKIYPWIFWQNRRVRGLKAAEVLIAQQQKGLEMLVARGILVKVNSVLIPGVNNEHLKEVSRVVKAKGAFLHNVMPLIAAPEHGTFFGVMGQRSPTHAELQVLQDACAGDMAMMRHCRQCRADAVGMLGEDRGAEFTMEKIQHMEIDHAASAAAREAVRAALAERLKGTAAPAVPAGGPRAALIAVATKGGGLINEHFGHAREFLIYEASAHGVRFVGTRRTDQYCTGATECDEEEGKLDRVLNVLEGCAAMLSARIGLAPWKALEAAGIRPNSDFAMEPIEASVKAIYDQLAATGALAEPCRSELPLATVG